MENKFRVSGNLLWQTGLRLDISSYDIRDPEKDFYELYNGDVKPSTKIDPTVNSVLTYKLNENWSLQWPIAFAQRSPDLTELFINHLSVGMDAYEYVGNPHLKSETNYQTDLIVQKNGERFTVYGDAFFSYLNHYISAVVDTTIHRKYMPCKPPKFAKRFINIDQALMTGFEAGMSIHFLKYLKFDFNASYTYAQNITMDEPLPEIPPFVTNLGLTYVNKGFTATFNSRMAAKQDRVSTSFNESSTPGFQVFNLYLSYAPWDFMDINVSITNIFDENYAEHLSRPYKSMDTQSLYYEPGRSFNVSVRMKF
jgi:iron complex outermembrane receptor protein